MLTGIFSKVLASIFTLAALSGGSYGIVRAISSSENITHQAQSNNYYQETKQKFIDNSPKQNTDDLIKEDEEINESESQKLSIITENNVEKTKEVDILPVTSTNLEKVKESFEDEKEKPKVELLVNEEDLDPELKVKAEKEELLKKSELEKKDKNIFLEANWIFSYGGRGSTSKSESCVLLNDSQKDKKLRDMQDEHDETHDESEDYACKTTSWYKLMKYETKEEDLWIRGKNEGIQRLIDTNNNWTTGAKFLKENHSSLTNIAFKFNGDICTTQTIDNENWTEIKCSYIPKTINK